MKQENNSEPLLVGHTYKCTIKGIFWKKNRLMPDLNDFLAECKKHYRAGGEMKANFQRICLNFIRRDLRGVKITKPVMLHYKHFEMDRRRDYSNIASFVMKVFEDALQQAGVLPNDSQRWVKGFTHEFDISKEKYPYIEVTIEELEK